MADEHVLRRDPVGGADPVGARGPDPGIRVLDHIVIAARPQEIRVRAVAALQPVVARAAVEDVVAAFAVERIAIAVEAQQQVVAFGAVQLEPGRAERRGVELAVESEAQGRGRRHAVRAVPAGDAPLGAAVADAEQQVGALARDLHLVGADEIVEHDRLIGRRDQVQPRVAADVVLAGERQHARLRQHLF